MQRSRIVRGFTLIELMVTVAIIGLLAAIAFPAYSKYMIKSNRGAAQAYLMELAQAENQYMADSRTYSSTVNDLVAPPAALTGKYTISIVTTAGPPATFVLKATPDPAGPQATDPELTLDQSGAKGPNTIW
jgi:type IV pilus assembly protein PilE